MSYDLNHLLTPHTQTDEQYARFSHVVFDNVIADDFKDNFAYLKIAVPYLNKYSLPSFENSNDGEVYYSEQEIKKSIRNLNIFQQFIHKDGLNLHMQKEQMSEQVDFILKQIVHKKISDTKFDFKVTALNLHVAHEAARALLFDYRNSGNLFCSLAHQMIELEQPGWTHDLKNISTSQDYCELFTKHHIKELLKQAGQTSEKNLKPFILIQKYMDFFMEYPDEFENFRNINNLPPEVACTKYIVDFNQILLNLKNEHLDILKTRTENSLFNPFLKQLLFTNMQENTQQANYFIVHTMLEKCPAWKEFLTIEELFPQQGLPEFLQEMDNLHKCNSFKFIPAAILNEQLENSLTMKTLKPMKKI